MNYLLSVASNLDGLRCRQQPKARSRVVENRRGGERVVDYMHFTIRRVAKTANTETAQRENKLREA